MSDHFELSQSMQEVHTSMHRVASADRVPSVGKTFFSTSINKRRLSQRFSRDRTTAEQHSAKDITFGDHSNSSNSNNTQLFYGTHGHIRRLLDYDYHDHYVKERQWLHDTIIEEFLLQQEDESLSSNAAFLPKSPCLILMVGIHGTGKHYVIRELTATDRLRLQSFVCIDTDDLRRYLPEYSSYLAERPVDEVNALTRKEAGYISETLTHATLQAGRNAIYHCNLKDYEWYKTTFIPNLRKTYPGLNVMMIHVVADPAVVLERSARFAEGRYVSEDQVVASLNKAIPSSVDAMKSVVDFWCTIRNNNDELELVEGCDWEKFIPTFEQEKQKEIPSYASSESLKRMPRHRRSVSTEGYAGFKSLTPRRKTCARLYKRSTETKKKPFSALRSSEDNHCSNDLNFYGQFAHIRATLDYTHHKNYTRERQLFQDAIIREFVDAAVVHDKNGVCSSPTEPWIVFTAGAMGCGKSYTMKKLLQKRRFPLTHFVSVDPDEIRRYLPDFPLYVRHCAELAGELTNKEAGYISEILTKAALQAGKNVIVDGSLRCADWYKGYFTSLRQEYRNLRIAILHITAPREAVFQRAAERAIQTGRIVPRNLLLEALDQVPRSVGELAPLADYHVELLNRPGASDIEIVTAGETWETFKSKWIQTCAWIPKSKSQEFLREKSRRLERKILVSALEC